MIGLSRGIFISFVVDYFFNTSSFVKLAFFLPRAILAPELFIEKRIRKKLEY